MSIEPKFDEASISRVLSIQETLEEASIKLSQLLTELKGPESLACHTCCGDVNNEAHGGTSCGSARGMPGYRVNLYDYERTDTGGWRRRER